ncbi:hypothetical protein BG015_005469 [Linnemannia schmuckeri]|uniref:YCII-related domain-containing protein n=1 Tax=Linnemannia schmuckeri TaxID=64567 RepID=A0A9P5R7K1_9FUNG|nr:hypothetical protein BG015_005469 [Linnemannia schmuckeri]
MFKAISSSRLAALPARIHHHHRSLSVSATANAAKNQFIVIARDFTDPEAFTRRLNVRPKHLVDAKELKKSGKLQIGGALLTDHSESGKMIGSIMIFQAEDAEEVRQLVEKDYYVTDKVWEHYQILPFRSADLS